MIEQHLRYLLVPGFSQTADAWSAVIESLPRPARTVPVTIPSGIGFVDAARDLAREHVGVWAGYSLGGRLALRVALDHPGRVAALVLISANPGVADADEREERKRRDEQLADWIERNGCDAFLDRWLAQPMFAGLDPISARRHRLTSEAQLADQLRRLGQGAQQPLWERLAELRMPVKVVAGEHDHEYVGIARETAAAIGPSSELVIVPGAGHALVLERPEVIAALLGGL